MGTTGMRFHGQKGKSSSQHFSKIEGFFEATKQAEKEQVTQRYLLRLLGVFSTFLPDVRVYLDAEYCIVSNKQTKKE
jgi:hypothetical protein